MDGLVLLAIGDPVPVLLAVDTPNKQGKTELFAGIFLVYLYHWFCGLPPLQDGQAAMTWVFTSTEDMLCSWYS